MYVWKYEQVTVYQRTSGKQELQKIAPRLGHAGFRSRNLQRHDAMVLALRCRDARSRVSYALQRLEYDAEVDVT